MQYFMIVSDIEFMRFKKLLKQEGYFVTAPRMRMFGLLQRHPALTLKELIRLTHKHDQVTVYRTVDLFERIGIINRLRLGWHTKIELSDLFQHHHHHVTCIRCGKIIDLEEDNDIENNIARLTKRLGFTPTDHQLEIRGYCQHCKIA